MYKFKDKNLYAVLGLHPSADKKEIKSAYRTLVRKYHPDVNKGNKSSEKMFIEITQAYDVLIDEVKRKKYDYVRGYNQPEEAPPQTKTEAPPPQSNKQQQQQAKQAYSKTQPPPSKQKNAKDKSKPFADVFSEFMESVFVKDDKPKSGAVNGTDITVDLTITVNEAKNGTVRRINVLHTQCCPNCTGKKFINEAKCNKCEGAGEVSSHKKILVKIPPDIKNGEKVMIAGEGNSGQNGGVNGNLYLKVNIEKSDMFRFDGLDVLSDIPITASEAALGTNILIPSIDGHINMRIPPETSSGQKFKLADEGIFDKDGKKRGNHIVTVYIKTPKNLSPEEKELYKKLSKARDFNPREDLINE
ncbi:MAG: DnaJ C-terminal domain-containing protein [Candidatus Gastranaerophilales bacterium]|nr:DnaJ C-terminal domain-containing protein [Candidatus Gastranaerophilales bacterium]